MFELRLMCPEHRVEAVSEALDALDALSVSVEDADAQTDAEVALFGEPGMPAPKEGWQRSRLTALFADGLAATQAGQLLQAQDFFVGCTVLGTNEVPDQDWVRLTQSQFAPVDITPTFWIVPTWHKPPEAAQTVIRLDPGLAFGTGTHPTTRMCLRWIANHPLPKTVLDYGCGSGILAIACAQFGSGHADFRQCGINRGDGCCRFHAVGDAAQRGCQTCGACGDIINGELDGRQSHGRIGTDNDVVIAKAIAALVGLQDRIAVPGGLGSDVVDLGVQSLEFIVQITLLG